MNDGLELGGMLTSTYRFSASGSVRPTLGAEETTIGSSPKSGGTIGVGIGTGWGMLLIDPLGFGCVSVSLDDMA